MIYIINRTYSFPPWVVLRLPLIYERVTDTRLDEIVGYETTFASGLRAMIPSLVTKVATTFSISLGEFSSLAWRKLISIQAFGEFHSLNIAVDEICMNTTSYRTQQTYTIHSRHHDHLVFDVPLPHKRKHERIWRQEYLYMRVGYNPRFLTT